MNRGVKPRTRAGIKRSLSVDLLSQEQHHHTSNITTPTTSPQQQPHHSTSPSQKHHHTIYPAHELSNRERFTPPAHHQSTKPAKPKTNMVT
jgi:hypothetical protein